MEVYCRYCVHCCGIGDKWYICELMDKMFHENRMKKGMKCNHYTEGTVDAITGKSL